MAGCAKLDLTCADAAFDASPDDGFLGIDIADDDCLFSDDESAGADVAVHFTVDLHVAGRKERASNDEVGADDRWHAVASCRSLGLNRLRLLRLRRHWILGFFTLDEHFCLP